MKTLFCLTLCCMVELLSYGQQQKLQINLKLKGNKLATEAMVLSYKNNKADTLASQKLGDKQIRFIVPASTEQGFYFLKVGNLKEVLTLFTDAGTIEITGTTTGWPKVEVKGSASHKDYEDYHLLTDSLESAGQILSKQYTAIDTRDTAIRSEMEKQLFTTIELYEKKQLEFVNSHLNSYYSPVVINNSKWGWQRKRAAYEKLAPSIKSSKYGIFLAQNIAKLKKASGLLEIGDTVPEFSARTTDDAALSLQKELGYNKLTLIDFWASWCVPCRQENPHLAKTYQENKAKGFGILGVSLDEKTEDWKAAIAKDGLVWEQVSDLQGWKSPILKLYFAGMPFNFIPQNFLVDAKGKILARNLRGDALSKKVAELLNGGSL